ncbi:SulP family inorganic anion transporter [Anaerotalea alkaliphila]|uniref:STAS domain-containing protein n=1 Tax=Anaerotalea alkaliphila TaxID=2662126 RepID=A0A7X5KLK8_9FIRM|nr:SulP family inorganic anion transporter [Anaerotalea alkaliphila]NDL66946.1 STAS domain-containing protein [Anaerotalea alkaliphila]
MKPKFFSILKHRDVELTKNILLNDIIAGIIVAIIALPLSVALGISSGVSPEKGLITAVVAGFLISFLGGSRVQIGGPTGAFVVIVYGIVQTHGLGGLAIATLMAGIFLIFLGLMRFGSVIKYIPYPITTGFTSGIAVVLFSTQIKDLLGLQMEEVPAEFFEKWEAYFSRLGTLNTASLLLGLVSIAVIVLWPRINKTIPGSLVALVGATLATSLFNLPVETIGSRFGDIPATIRFVDFGTLDFSLGNLQALVGPAITIAFLAGIESLLSAVVADGMIGKRHNSNMELVAQGIANIGSVLFGGIPATGAIARTAANVRNGGRTPVAGITHAVVLLLIMLLFMPYAKLIPLTVLSAILVVVAYNMSEWRSFKGLFRSTKSDVSVLLTTFLFTVVFDLVVAIQFGMVMAMFLFVHRMGESMGYADVTRSLVPGSEDADDTPGTEGNGPVKTKEELSLDSELLVYEINGPLFFGAANTFLDVLQEIRSHTSVLVFKMKNVPIMDATALDALKRIEKRCRERKVLLLFAEVNPQPLKLLRQSGFLDRIGEDRLFSAVEDAVGAGKAILASKETA